jgi:hypothetical protein
MLIDADMAWTHARCAHAGANGDRGSFIGNAVSRVGLLGVTVHPGEPRAVRVSVNFKL